MSNEPPRSAILLVAHGTVEQLADLPAFLARIRHGRPAPAGLVEELSRRYQAIGGSPLLRVTEEQARALEARTGLPVMLGMRLWEPSVEAAFREAARRGIARLVLVPLAPFSVEVYGAAARALARKCARGIGRSDSGTRALRSMGHRARVHRGALCSAQRTACVSIPVTARSCSPRTACRAPPSGLATVTKPKSKPALTPIAERLGRSCELAYQSQGADGGEWLGPDLRQTFERLAQAGARQITALPLWLLG